MHLNYDTGSARIRAVVRICAGARMSQIETTLTAHVFNLDERYIDDGELRFEARR